MTTGQNEYSEDLMTTVERNTKPVTITLTAIEIFTIVNTIQIADAEDGIISKDSLLCSYAREVARKMHDHLDPNSLLFLQRDKGWE
jgi:hypothetical protein